MAAWRPEPCHASAVNSYINAYSTKTKNLCVCVCVQPFLGQTENHKSSQTLTRVDTDSLVYDLDLHSQLNFNSVKLYLEHLLAGKPFFVLPPSSRQRSNLDLYNFT